MAAKKKKGKARKKASKPPASLAKRRVPSLEETVTSLNVPQTVARLEEQLALMAEQSRSVDGEFPQELLQATMLVDAVAKLATKAVEAVKAVITGHHENAGAFEGGRVVVTFVPWERCSPAWKGVAFEQARMLVEEQGDKFDKDEFEKQVKAETGMTSGNSLKLVESV